MRTIFLSFIFLAPFSAHCEDWSLTDPLLGWNNQELVRRYFHNSEHQVQWAWRALSSYRFRGDERILDFGSGDGKLSSLISLMVPKGSVTGVDLSREMIVFANKMFPSEAYCNLHFFLSDDLDFHLPAFPDPFDLVVSFCVLHLVPHPTLVLKHIREKMSPNGKCILCWPIFKNNEILKAASEEMAIRGWNFPMPTVEAIAMRNLEKIPQIFRDAGFVIEDLQVISTRDPFSTKEEFIDWCEGSVTANWNIPLGGRREFFSSLIDRYLQYRPQDQDSDGFVHLSNTIVQLIAKPM